MAGIVLETLSWKKLLLLALFLIIAEVLFCLIGGVLVPNRNSVISTPATFCVDTNSEGSGGSPWFVPRGNETCTNVGSLEAEEEYNGGFITTKQIVFAFWLPYQRDDNKQAFSKRQRSLVGALEISTLNSTDVTLTKDAQIMIETRIGCRNKGDNSSDWTELSSSQEKRSLNCKEGELLHGLEGVTRFTCHVAPFLTLPGLHYDYYLVNFRVPVRPYEDINMHIGMLRDITLKTTFQNGDYTKLWLYVKTLTFPLVLMSVVWYWRRVCKLARSSTLLERTLFALGIVISLLNCPVEWLTLVADIQCMTLINEVRQTLFFGILLSFGIIFTGEHMCEWSDGNFLQDYWKRLFAIFTGCFLYLLFKVCERGVTLANKFDSIWMTEKGVTISLALLITLGVAFVLYTTFLCYMSVRVYRYTGKKECHTNRRTYCVGLKCMLVATLACVASVFAFLVMTELYEGQWKWAYGSLKLQDASAFWFGVYGIWNTYVVSLLSLFAPSNKPQRPSDEGNYGLVSDIAEGEVQT